ncbi:MAG: M23 family metallopeptidase [Desulfuromonadales bacterium]|nr:M23 family metallopeptidase [Desulfuromonadales bacterium]
MNRHYFVLLLSLFCFLQTSPSLPSSIDDPDLAELSDTPAAARSATPLTAACASFNELNTRIRDRRIGRPAAQTELTRLLAGVRAEYYRAGGRDYPRSEWVFPLAGYDSRAIDGGRQHGYVPGGYDYYSGNSHGGHPALDIFIRDRNQDSLDDRSGRPVKVVALTGGVVVALEREWEPGSPLRGGKYLWIYDPGSDLLVYYAHNNGLSVGLGEIVRPGDVLASVGRSGYNAAKRRSPTHLHFSVLKVGSGGQVVPMDVYRELKGARGVTAH